MTQIVKVTNKNGIQVFPQTHTKAVVDDNGNSVESMLATKQDTISDLTTIRNGAAAGATAIQSVNVGTTTTGAAGTNASVINSGTVTEPVLNFTIPQGVQGVKGDTVIMGGESSYTLYNTTGDAVDGAMTQQAVTRGFAELPGRLYKVIGLTASISIPITLPAGYTVLDYIANTSSSGGYIDTGILPNDSNWKFKGSWMLTGTITAYQSIMVSHSEETANSYRIIYNNTSTTGVLINANTKASTATVSPVNGANEWNTFSIQYGTATINGTVVSLGTTAGTAITNNVNLFGKSSSVNFLVGKMGRFKAWHNGILVRDMIPCINPQSIYGMYDIVNNVFYGSSNENNFTGGN